MGKRKQKKRKTNESMLQRKARLIAQRKDKCKKWLFVLLLSFAICIVLGYYCTKTKIIGKKDMKNLAIDNAEDDSKFRTLLSNKYRRILLYSQPDKSLLSTRSFKRVVAKSSQRMAQIFSNLTIVDGRYHTSFSQEVLQLARTIKLDLKAGRAVRGQNIGFIFSEIVLNSDAEPLNLASGSKLVHVKIPEVVKKAQPKLRDVMNEKQVMEGPVSLARNHAWITDNAYQDYVQKLKRGEEVYAKTFKDHDFTSRIFLHDSTSLITNTGQRLFSKIPQEKLTAFRNGKLYRLTQIGETNVSTNNELEFVSWKNDDKGVRTAQIFKSGVTGEEMEIEWTREWRDFLRGEHIAAIRTQSGRESKNFEHPEYVKEPEKEGMNKSIESSKVKEKISTSNSAIGIYFLLCLSCIYFFTPSLRSCTFFLNYCVKKIQRKPSEIKKLKEEKHGKREEPSQRLLKKVDDSNKRLQESVRSQNQLEKKKNEIKALKNQNRSLQKQLLEEKQSSSRKESELQKQIRAMMKKQREDASNICQICYKYPRTHALSCGHVYCKICLEAVKKEKKCWFCRKKITSNCKIFL